MDLLPHLALGFGVAFHPINLLYALIGALVGTLIGVLPGIGPVATIAMLLPITYALQPVSALIMLAGIYYGAQYGGSTTSILLNMPGETSSAVTCLDGYQMARKGQAGVALATAALGSFFAGTVGTLMVATVAQPLSEFALKCGPAGPRLLAARHFDDRSRPDPRARGHRRQFRSRTLFFRHSGDDRRPWGR